MRTAVTGQMLSVLPVSVNAAAVRRRTRAALEALATSRLGREKTTCGDGIKWGKNGPIATFGLEKVGKVAMDCAVDCTSSKQNLGVGSGNLEVYSVFYV